MTATLESLEAKRAEYLRSKEEHEARANACAGAVAVLNDLITEMRQKTGGVYQSNPKRPKP